jgi:hypothetical protein
MSLFDFSEQYYKDLAHNCLVLLFDTLLANNIDTIFDNLIKYFPISELKSVIAPDNINYDKLLMFSEKEITSLYNKLNICNTQLKNSLGHSNTLLELTKNLKKLFYFQSVVLPILNCPNVFLISSFKT